MSTIKGKTYEKSYGVEKATKLRKLRSDNAKKNGLGKKLPPWNKGKKGSTPWNKGITKDDPRVAKYANTLSKVKKGKSNPTMQGEKHWNWKGGLSKDKYCVGWRAFPIKKQVLIRDDHKCQICGVKHINKGLVIHHIDYDKYNNDISNLISLCRKCHAKTNFNRDYWKSYFTMLSSNQILILGGTGSWGKQLTYTLLDNPNVTSITIFSRNEFNQVTMQREFNDDRLKFIIGDIRDYDAVFNACKNKTTVFLLSALKHVPLCEEQPNEAIKTNIIGVQNVINACIAQDVVHVIDVSSDKAAAANNLYGMTKAIGEKLIISADKKSATRFKCIRGGNVLGSNGSVCQLFIDQIKKDNIIRVTSKEMSRYFLTLEQAIQLLLAASDLDFDMLVIKMPSCLIYDLAKVLIDHYGNKDTKIIETGIRPGEKLHEELITEWEAAKAYKYGSDFFVISETPLKLPKFTAPKYSSNSQKYMNNFQIKRMLRKGGFLL